MKEAKDPSFLGFVSFFQVSDAVRWNMERFQR